MLFVFSVRCGLPRRQAAEMSAYSGRSEITPVRCDWVVGQRGFELMAIAAWPRGDDHVAERGRRDLTIPESLTLRARGIAT